jgi:hypothetical protein
MKKIFVIAALMLALGAGLAVAGPGEFSKGNFFLTPQVGYASWGNSIPFGLSAEYAVSDIFGIGGTVMGQFWSESYGSVSLVMVLAEANYHFVKLTADKLDLYFGLGLGYGMYSVTYNFGFLEGASGSSGLRLLPILGGRYYISPKVALSLRILGSIIGSGNSGLGASVGVTIKLK